jgi:translation initiation factor IF-3
MLDRIAQTVSDVAQVEQQARMEGRQMSMMLVSR